ncbi:MAG TPA: hypothetical protein VJU81_25855 [Methylomirabilota bacterium]|nr:hypothetical protein [Methylomirabilota bacterium]
MRRNPIPGLLLVVGLILGLGATGPRADAAPKDRWPADQYFQIDSRTFQMKNGQLGVWGYVNSLAWQHAKVRLEVEGLDAQGNVLGYQTVNVDNTVPLRGRAYFEAPLRIPGAVNAKAYILWYDWVGESRGDFMRLK